MKGYAKLFGTIIASTIWRETKETKIVWITMLAMADRNGLVEASVPGLADFSRVTVDECRDALKVLSSPDADSRTKDFEGRRIQEVDGGWQILNYSKYREKLNSLERRDYLASKQREARERKKSASEKCQHLSTPVNTRIHTEAEATAEAEANGVLSTNLLDDGTQEGGIEPQAGAIYDAYPRKIARAEGIRAIKKALKNHAYEFLLHKTEEFAKAMVAAKKEKTFIPYPATWFNGERYEEDPATWKEETTTRKGLQPVGDFTKGDRSEIL